MPIIYSGERGPVVDRSDLQQYALWFEQRGMHFSLDFGYGKWRVRAWYMDTMESFYGKSSDTVAGALHNCYTSIRNWEEQRGPGSN